MNERNFYVCGHAGDAPAHMGRGAARRRRIAAHFGRRCPACHEVALRARASRLTHANGTRYTSAEQADYLARHGVRLPAEVGA